MNRGLLPATGRVPVHSFPQGNFRQEKTPRVNKGKVVFTDTFETGDFKFRYEQAFVDYRFSTDRVAYYSTCTNLTPLEGLFGSEPPGDPPGDEGVHNIHNRD